MARSIVSRSCGGCGRWSPDGAGPKDARSPLCGRGTSARCSETMRPPSARIAARSRMFRSSRTLPGQGYSVNACLASREIPAGGRPIERPISRRNASLSGRMSSGRSRSGGSFNSKTFKRKYRSSRNNFCSMALRRSRLVAATTRTSAFSTRVPPSRWNSRSCKTRRNFACAGRAISPTSSRKSTPPAACSSSPGLD